MKKLIFLSTIVYLTSVTLSFGLDTETHQYLNEDISKKTMNGFSLDGYLINQLGIVKGRNELLSSNISRKSLKVYEWLRDGGLYEDKPPWVLPYLRSANHFHNPITDKGFTGVPPGDSAIVWSQKPLGQQWIGGHYSWPDSRENFFKAMISTNKADREEKFAETFRGVGQLMHLMQDMSVPEHARNDFHALPAYEEWLADKSNQVAAGILSNSTVNPIYPDSSLLLQQSTFTNASVPIANLFDTNQYNGSVTVATLSTTFGLSEYTSSNFFSPDTIFDSNYPFPRWSAMQEWDDTINGKKRTYLRKIADGEQISHAATGRWFYKYLPAAIKSSGLKLDENVFADYANLLLPRTVGYSTALLNYFFRGTLNITAVPDDVTFRSVKITASNSTPNEAMGTGEVSLVIRFKALTETDLGNGKFLLNNPAADYSYKVVKLLNVDLSSPRELTFDLSADPLPFNFSDMTMQLVYSGSLGNESGAVAVSTPYAIDGIYTDFDLSLPTSGVYAKTSDNSPTATFNELRLTALSDIPGGLSGGTITLALDYRTAIGDQFQSVLVDTEPVNAAGYIFRASEKNGVNTLPQGVPVELVFDLPQLPVAATDLEMNIIYTKADGTQAIGYRDISEPTPVDVFNSTDYTCLNGAWYKHDDPAAMAIVDSDSDGIADRSDIYPHTINDISFLAGPADTGTLDASASSTLFAPGPLATDQMLRLGYILTDYANRYAISDSRSALSGDPWPHATISNNNYPGTGFRNDATTWSSMFTFRRADAKMWWGASVIFVNREYPLGSNCNFDALNQKLGL